MLDTLHWIPSHQQYLYHLKSRWRNSHVLVKKHSPLQIATELGVAIAIDPFTAVAAARVTLEAASGLVTL